METEFRMLFGYPIAATHDNWLHDCLYEVLQLMHTSLTRGERPPVWPDVLPELYRNRLKRRTGLKDKLNSYQEALSNLTLGAQQQILQAFNNQNKIAMLLSCKCDCEAIADLPSAIQQPIKDLFEFAFSLLTDLEIRDNHYKAIYDAALYRTCPFCGCESFDAPGAPREALDHYLPKNKYSFASANLRNLVPMGNKCNSRYKLAKDILRKDDGTRRRSFDPYNHHSIVKVSLNNSQPFAGTCKNGGQALPKWEIDFSIDSEEVTTWDDIFHVRERYARDVLDSSFDNWLNGFRSWCRSRTIPNSDKGIVDAMEEYATYHESLGFGDRSFLKAALFRMLHVHCQDGDLRLIQFIREVVTGCPPLE
jgi:hypothetical protein